jgi:hypothetical protein
MYFRSIAMEMGMIPNSKTKIAVKLVGYTTTVNPVKQHLS